MRPSSDGASPFVLQFAVALHRAGIPAHRLEGLCDLVAQRLGVQARIFSMPTAVFATVGPEHAAHTELLRVTPGAPNLGLQAELDAIAESVIIGSMSVDAARDALADLANAKPTWSTFASLVAFALTGATAAIVLGGGPAESAASTVAGLLVGILAEWVGSESGLSNLFEPVATFASMTLALLTHHLVTQVDVVVVTLASVIVLLPGLSLTTSIVELATRNLVSGTARLAGAMVVFVGMAVGAALGATWTDVLPPPPPPVAMPMPEEVRWAVLPVVGVMLAVLLRARPRDVGWCALAPVVAVGFGQIGTLGLGEVLGAGAAGFGLTVVSNAVSRIRRRPASTLLVPGILLLVPGSMGLRAILALVDHDVLTGVDGLFAALLVATSLASGVLLANVALRPRRAL